MDIKRRQDPEGLPDHGGTGVAAAGLVEGFLRDALVNGCVLLSLVTVVAGFMTKQAPLIALGIAVGTPGIVAPWLGIARKWSVALMWLVIGTVLVADVAALSLMWFTT